MSKQGPSEDQEAAVATVVMLALGVLLVVGVFLSPSLMPWVLR